MKKNAFFERFFKAENALIKQHPRAYAIMAAMEELQTAGREIERREVPDPDFIRRASAALIREMLPDKDAETTQKVTEYAVTLALNHEKIIYQKATMLDEMINELEAAQNAEEFNQKAIEKVNLLSLVVMMHTDQNTQATEIGIDPDRFNSFVHGELLPDPEERQKIAAYYETSEKSIFGDEIEMQKNQEEMHPLFPGRIRMECIIFDLMDALRDSGWNDEKILNYLNDVESHLTQGDARKKLSRLEIAFLFGEDEAIDISGDIARVDDCNNDANNASNNDSIIST